jgi:iron complex outermembrane receptor protein
LFFIDIGYKIGKVLLTVRPHVRGAIHMHKRTSLAAMLSASAVFLGSTAFAADSDAVETVTVTSSRISTDLKTFAGSVTVISRDDVLTQTKFSNDLGQLLSNSIPGLAVSSSGSYSNFDQTLRGRKPAIFIDGIPVSVTLRDGGRDNRLIGTNAIGGIEVVSGATAIYGLGGAGGLINYVTRTPGEGAPEFETNGSFGGSLTNFSDSTNFSVGQSALGRFDNFSYVVTGNFEKYNSLFDADGDRIPPDPQSQGGIADTKTYNFFAKLGYDLTDTQHIYLTGSAYELLQDTDYSNGVGVYRVSKTPAVPVPPLGNNQFTRNHIASLRYLNENIFGSSLDVDAYYSQYKSLFAFYAYPYYPPNGGQSSIDNFERGIRTTINTPVDLGTGGGNVQWGVDYSYIDSRQRMTNGQLLVPDLKQNAIAPFAQASLPVTPWLTLNGGIRWEDDSIAVNTFTTIPIYTPSLPGGVTVQGGTLDYSKVLFNIGGVVAPFSSGPLAGASAYAVFSQGFSVGDFGRALRSTTATSISQFDFKPQVIDSYEIGLRADYPGFTGHIAGYFNTSEYGSTFNAVTFELVRAPEHIWGLEAAWDVKPTDTFSWGGSVSWTNGRTQNVTTEVWSPLDDTRIPPLKLMSYVQEQFLPDLMGRAQLTYSGNESRFPGNPGVYGKSNIPAFALLDLMVSYDTDYGTWTLAADNVLNEDYYTPDSYIYATNTNFTKGQGATFRISYSIKY